MQLHTILPERIDFLPYDDMLEHTLYQGSPLLCHGPYENVAVDSR
jgi:hypothetical protein